MVSQIFLIINKKKIVSNKILLKNIPLLPYNCSIEYLIKIVKDLKEVDKITFWQLLKL